MKKFTILCLVVLLSSISISSCFAIELEDLFDKDKIIKDLERKIFSESISTDKFLKEMGFGWSLSNALDAIDFNNPKHNHGLESEICWGNPYTTFEMIEKIGKKGIKTLKVPVTWHNHFIDENYTIDPKWMKRVKTVVDWGISLGLNVVINNQHDDAVQTENVIAYGSGFIPTKKDKKESERFLYNLWRQISIAFNNGYDEHLIFETIGAPRLGGNKYEWDFDKNDKECMEAASIINEFNELCVEAIRATGGNNAKRFIIVTPYAADFNTVFDTEFKFPDDSKYNPKTNRIFIGFHFWTPKIFTKGLVQTEFSDSFEEEIDDHFKKMYESFTRKGHNVVLAEMGAIDKNNLEERIKWADYFVRKARKYHIPCILWDNGHFSNGKEVDGDEFGLFLRNDLKWNKEGLINTYVKRSEVPFGIGEDIFSIAPEEFFDKEKALKDEEVVIFNEDITAEKVSSEIGFGWNLGNTLDSSQHLSQTYNQGLESEICWGNPYTTEEMIEAIAKKGIKALRVPVTWHNHLIDEEYTIDPKWMARVKTIVDWGLKYGLYVILNSHHDNFGSFIEIAKYGEGYYPNYANIDESERFIFNIWRQIALAFNNGYDHHLIFEGLNEPRLAGYKNEWFYQIGDKNSEEAIEVLNEYMRLIVKAIRETGGNNRLRFIMVTPYAAQYSSAMDSNFIFPDDSKYNPDKTKLILSVHMYFPYDFALGYDWDYHIFDQAGRKLLNDDFKNLYEKFIDKGYQIIIGEMGALYKKNQEQRIAWANYYTSVARKYRMSCILWDNNFFKDSPEIEGENLGEFHRDTLTWESEEMISAYLIGSKTVWKSQDID